MSTRAQLPKLSSKLVLTVCALLVVTIALKIQFQSPVFAPTLNQQLDQIRAGLERAGYDIIIVSGSRPELMARKDDCVLTVVPVGAEGVSSAYMKTLLGEGQSTVYFFRGGIYPDHPPRWEAVLRQHVDKLLRAMHLPSTFPAVYRASYGSVCSPLGDLAAASLP